MPSGGHARSGPPRDPYALRRPGTPAENGWTQLTAPTEAAPSWPLADPASPAEAAIWADLWSRPQATVWPRLNLVREVAVHARCLAEFEAPGKTNAALGNLIRKQADDLGLSVVGAERNMWLMPKADAPTDPAPVRRTPSRSSSRERFGSSAAHAFDGSGRDADGRVIPARERFRRVPAAASSTPDTDLLEESS